MSSAAGAPAPKDPHVIARKVIDNASFAAGIGKKDPHPFMELVLQALAHNPSSLANDIVTLQSLRDPHAKTLSQPHHSQNDGNAKKTT